MASNIKGIIIEIEGKTDGLAKSLKEVDKSIKETQTALKKVNEALKLDPKNVQLVAEKQKLLQQQIENTSNRLQMLEQAAQEAAQALANGEISEAEYAQLAAEVELCRQNLEQLNKEAANSNGISQAFEEAGKKLDEVGHKLDEVGDKVKGFGDGMTKNVTAPIVAAGAASVASFKEVDKSMDIVIKKTGATGEKLEEFEQIFKNIATTVPVDMDKVGAAVGEVNTRFGVTGDELEKLSVAFIEFSEINNTDVSNSVDNVQKALAAFGLDADDAADLLDRLSYVSQNSGANVDTLTAGLIQNAAAFQEMGLSIDQAAQFMGELETSGANSETVMQGMRKALKNAAEDGTDLNTALMDLQNSILNGTDDMDGLTYAYEMFGKSGDQIYSSVRNGTVDFSNLGAAAEDAGGTVARTFEATNDPLNNTRTTMNKLKLTLGDVGESLAGLLVPAVEKVSDALSELNSWWNSLDESQQKTILTVAAFVAALGPVISVIGTLIGTVGSLLTGLGALSTLLGTTGLAATFAALGPIILEVTAVIAGIVAIGWGLYEVVTGIIDIVENWDLLMAQLGEDLGVVFGGIKEDWDSAVAGIGQGIEEAKKGWDDMKESFKSKWNEMNETSKSTWTTIKEDAVAKALSMRDGVQEKVDAIRGFFEELGPDAYKWGKDLLQNFIDGLKAMWGSFTGTIGDITQYIKDNLGFSEPKEGPLSNFHTFSPDMIDLWNKGIYDNLDKVQESSQVMAQTVAVSAQPTDYSGALSGISGQLASMAGNGQPINVYIGSDRIGTAIARSNARAAYISGGH